MPPQSTTPAAGEKAQGSAAAPGASSSIGEKSYFELQREALVNEIALSLEHVLMNINKLNRSLESVIVVGKEFDAVENLWSQFEGVMAQDNDGETEGNGEVGEGIAVDAEGDEGNDTVTY